MGIVRVDPALCARDGLCIGDCPVRVLDWGADGLPEAVPDLEAFCLHCGHCAAICPRAALTLDGIDPSRLDTLRGEWAIAPEAAVQYLRSRRSLRAFEQRAVPREQIIRALDATRWAPTATNRQPVQWLVIETPGKMRALAAMIADGLRAIPYFEHMVERFGQGEDCILRGAPQLVVAYASLDGFEPAADCTIALAYFELAAQAYGLGTCWAGVLLAAMQTNPAIAPFLGIPENHGVRGAMMVGYPRYTYPRIPARNPLRVTWA